MSDSPSKDTETVSKKPRRGRPPAFEPELGAAMLPVWSDLITTKRSLRNKQYSVHGLHVTLLDGRHQDRYGWFAGPGKGHRQAILVEMGRIAARYGDATALAMADKLFDKVAAGEFSTTREGAGWLRQARLEASKAVKPATAEALEKVITTTIVNWMAEHADATPALVGEALSGAYSLMEVYEGYERRRGALRQKESNSETVSTNEQVANAQQIEEIGP